MTVPQRVVCTGRASVVYTLLTVVSAYCASLLIVLAGISYAQEFEKQGRAPSSLLDCLTHWDGHDYVALVNDGYWHEPGVRSPVVFYPAYPLAGRLLKCGAGLDGAVSLLVVAHLALMGSLLLFAVFLDSRDSGATGSGWALAALALWPTTFFFRMAYSESLFLLLLLLSMLAMQEGWRPVVVAPIIGRATATRGPGVALLPVFALYVWQRTRGEPTVAATSEAHSPAGRAATGAFVAHCLWLLPLASWGLLAYMAFLYVQFGDPLLFAKAQGPRFLTTPASVFEQASALVTLQPLWSVYDPSSEAYWANREPIRNPLFSLHFANPIYFLICALLLAIGWFKKWLDARETLLGALLLLIPYVALGYQNWMVSQGRFAAVVFPAYIVMGRMLHGLPVAVSACLLGLCAWFLGVYSALFAAQYRFY